MSESGETRHGRGAESRAPRGRAAAWLRRLQWTCFAVGAALMLYFAGSRLQSAASARLEVGAFDLAAAAQSGLDAEWRADQSLWSEGRIAKFRESLSRTFEPPLAVLRVPKIGLVVPVLAGTDEQTLDRAVGAIAGTALPGEGGNVGIAGHRDGFFRGLKDVELGDEIELETLAVRRRYRVASIRIVAPTEVSVLAATSQPALTLVTCFPFYFIGSAPQRYIIRADLLPATGDVEASLHR